MTNDSSLNFPENTDLPFFAYGIFKPRQIAYSRIKEFEKEDPERFTIKHKLYLRDGIPFISRDEKKISTTEGFLFKFKENESEDAYRTICETISDKLYYWMEIDVCNQKANALIGRRPSRSRPTLLNRSFDGRNDPYFNEALDLISADLEDNLDFQDMIDYFKIQRNYILLWAAIERYCSLRYGPHSKTKNNEKLASEVFFQQSLKNHVPIGNTRDIYRTDTLDNITLDCDEPLDSLNYYYTIRCNIAHRGKGPIREFSIVLDSLKELLGIFNDILDYTFG